MKVSAELARMILDSATRDVFGQPIPGAVSVACRRALSFDQRQVAQAIVTELWPAGLPPAHGRTELEHQLADMLADRSSRERGERP